MNDPLVKYPVMRSSRYMNTVSHRYPLYPTNYLYNWEGYTIWMKGNKD